MFTDQTRCVLQIDRIWNISARRGVSDQRYLDNWTKKLSSYIIKHAGTNAVVILYTIPPDYKLEKQQNKSSW